MKKIEVSTGQLSVEKGDVTMEAHGVGSCIVLGLYEQKKKIIGMAHIMLPTRVRESQRLVLAKDASHVAGYEGGAYADEAVSNTVDAILGLGGDISNLEASIAGGAEMFKSLWGKKNSLGSQNEQAVRQELRIKNIEIVYDDTGGHSGRSVSMDSITGRMSLKKIKDH